MRAKIRCVPRPGTGARSIPSKPASESALPSPSCQEGQRYRLAQQEAEKQRPEVDQGRGHDDPPCAAPLVVGHRYTPSRNRLPILHPIATCHTPGAARSGPSASRHARGQGEGGGQVTPAPDARHPAGESLCTFPRCCDRASVLAGVIGRASPYRNKVIQDPAYGLRRIQLLGTSVNKCFVAEPGSRVCHHWSIGKLRARGRSAWGLRALSGGVQ